jgi:hypothetical protein
MAPRRTGTVPVTTGRITVPVAHLSGTTTELEAEPIQHRGIPRTVRGVVAKRTCRARAATDYSTASPPIKYGTSAIVVMPGVGRIRLRGSY